MISKLLEIKNMDKIKSIDWAAWVGTLLLIIGF
ncbi:membrane protein, partial [Acinetobacter baumannii]